MKDDKPKRRIPMPPPTQIHTDRKKKNQKEIARGENKRRLINEELEKMEELNNE